MHQEPTWSYPEEYRHVSRSHLTATASNIVSIWIYQEADLTVDGTLPDSSQYSTAHQLELSSFATRWRDSAVSTS